MPGTICLEPRFVAPDAGLAIGERLRLGARAKVEMASRGSRPTLGVAVITPGHLRRSICLRRVPETSRRTGSSIDASVGSPAGRLDLLPELGQPQP